MKRIIAVVVYAIFVIQFVSLANGGPMVREGSTDSVMVPEKNEYIEVLAEDLKYEVKIVDGEVVTDYNFEQLFYADVTAKYTMFNSSKDTEKVSIAFPYSTAVSERLDDNITVKADGKIISFELVKMEGITHDSRNFESLVKKIDDDFNENYGSGDINDKVGLILFDVEFESNAEHELVVEYKTESVQVTDSSFIKEHEWRPRFSYYFEPAKYWKSFGNINMSIILPDGYEIINSNLEDYDVDDNVYSKTLYGVEVDELVFELDKKPEDVRWVYVFILFSILAIVIVFHLISKKKHSSQ